MYVRTVERQAPFGPPSIITELRFQRCTWCQTVVFRSRLLCPVCSSTELRGERSVGRGKVCSSVEVLHKGQRPRPVAVVELQDGVRMRCELEGGSSGASPYGAAVSVVEIAPDGLPVFRLDPVKSERW